MLLAFFQRWTNYLATPIPIFPLITFRIAFGCMMTFSVLRFWYLGWIEDHYINVTFTFKYFGFEWVTLPPPMAVYGLHVLLLLGALGLLLGACYRLAAILHFLCFTYLELIDLTYYLNHYYFVSLVSGLLIFVPAAQAYSVDSFLAKKIQKIPTNSLLFKILNLFVELPATHTPLLTPRWAVEIFKWQIAIVYIYAGIAKINTVWLLEALPLKIWLLPHESMPILGKFLVFPQTAYIFSWVGMIYDTTIVFWLAYRPTRLWAYISVIVFHVLTGLLFQIGVFPLVMIVATLLFFSNEWHSRWLAWLPTAPNTTPQQLPPMVVFPPARPILSIALLLYFAFQVVFPWRFLCYKGNLFWTEQGYRFSWRVMLMEKAGTATFYVKDTANQREGVVDNREFLKPHQEKQMAMQPDMLLQYAHFLAKHYAQKGLTKPKVRAEVYITLNGQPSKLLFSPDLDLTQLKDDWSEKTWLYPID